MSALPARPVASLMREAAFRRIWLVGLLGGVSRWLEMLVVGIYAIETTDSPFLVALLILLRMLPFALFGPLVGAFADRLPPRPCLAGAFLMGALVSGTVLVLFVTGQDAYWVVAAASMVSGLLWTTDMPLRRRMLGDIAGTERLAPAMGIDSATGNGTRTLGPLLGGLLYQALGAGGAFALSTLFYGAAVVLVLGLPEIAVAAATTGRGERLLRQMREAVVFALSSRDMTAILLVTVIFNVWCFPVISMIPVIGAEALHLDPAWIGALAACEGAGALFGAIAVAMWARPGLFRLIYAGGTGIYMALAFLAGSLTAALPVAFALFLVGLASACFGTMQSTLVYATAPPAMRGRLFGLLVLCIGSGLLGFANIGWMGDLYGGAAAVRIVALEGLVPLVLVVLFWRGAFAARHR
ncbi:MAG: MFS transporter [Proteobacteria bacterium]|nr:MFS transporter [Pseudomonadota bacterium]